METAPVDPSVNVLVVDLGLSCNCLVKWPTLGKQFSS